MAKLLSSNVATFLGVFTASQSVVGCITNTLVLLYFLLSRRSLSETADKLILNLCIADFFALVTYVPWRSYLLFLRTTTGNFKIYTSLFVVCIFSTGNAILLIGFDRFIAVVWPLRYRVLITSNVLWIAVVVSWLTAILLGVGHAVSYEIDIHKEYELLLCALSFSQLIILSIIYAVILRTARVQAREMARRFGSFTSTTSNQHYSMKRTIRTTFLIVCFFYAVFLPYAVYRVVSTADKSISNDEKHVTWRWLNAFTFLNSCFDPLIYFFGMKKYRTRFRQRLSRINSETAEEMPALSNVTRESQCQLQSDVI
ncbi:histamine H2 receptor-like [Dendronephthya gigantea]|uniref:histamine H2 receptor-like n=1 Tax=Dendronephthya gigantea TaxID=151771 RepID=UPI00106B70AE|nr:histamine H2 receptor-like [Dendronephthya gigantea]